MRFVRFLSAVIACWLLLAPRVAAADPVRVAAASDLRYALAELRAQHAAARPGASIELVFGSSGKLAAQIENGAPFDIFFSADAAYPQRLRQRGFCAGEPRLYARGRLVVWCPREAAGSVAIADLAAPRFRKLALANPRHAPYGQRARQALEKAGVTSAVESRLVLGENVSQAAQLVESGAADAGLVALSLLFSPGLPHADRYSLVPESMHEPLDQSFCVLKRAAVNSEAVAFARFCEGRAAHAILRRYGFAASGGNTP
ncbi:MAG: molybdate ABC transporter substrate-binding protein [Candidatus Wallbacteria bacterium]|nr:molybdate ABC transporter substrate-binding protein [Candidatus Wallbacteria bacterium]